MDTWELDDDGNQVCHDTDPSQDAVRIVDSNGNVKASTSFEYGTIKQTQSMVSGNSAYEINGNDNSTNLFEFLAENTQVEWANNQFYSDKSYLVTSHKDGFVIDDVIDMYPLESIKSRTHNHFVNAYPTGLEKRNRDIGNAAILEERNPNMKSYIYAPWIKDYNERYIPYNSQSTFCDFKYHPAYKEPFCKKNN